MYSFSLMITIIYKITTHFPLRERLVDLLKERECFVGQSMFNISEIKALKVYPKGWIPVRILDHTTHSCRASHRCDCACDAEIQ